VLERDGWAPYRRFTRAAHQTCLAYLLRRCRELLADAKRGQAKTPHAIRRILKGVLAVRDGRDAGELDQAGAAAEAGRLGGQVDKLIAGRTVDPPNRRLLDHLGRERDALFTFLARPGVQATNWRAEHAIGPAVVCRKQWGGNATWKGAETWQVLASVVATACLQQRDPVELLAGLLCAPGVGRVRPCHPQAWPGAREPTRRTPQPTVRYRVMVAELVGDTATVVMDATGAGFHAAVGELADGCLLAQRGVGG
jgi:transposase